MYILDVFLKERLPYLLCMLRSMSQQKINVYLLLQEQNTIIIKNACGLLIFI